MNKLYYYIVVFIMIIVFIILVVGRNKNATNEWVDKIEFYGTIQDVYHFKNVKGTYMKIEGKWYIISYDRKFEKQNFIGYLIKKNIGEKGIWIANSKDTKNLEFQWSLGGVVVDANRIKVLENLP